MWREGGRFIPGILRVRHDPILLYNHQHAFIYTVYTARNLSFIYIYTVHIDSNLSFVYIYIHIYTVYTARNLSKTLIRSMYGKE